MTLETLRRLSGWVDRIAVEMKAELETAEAHSDPLGAYIYRARAAYRRTLESDKSKDGKKIERQIIISYQQARELGFTGKLEVWALVLKCGR